MTGLDKERVDIALRLQERQNMRRAVPGTKGGCCG
jgi:hypothetical protein